MTVVYVFLLPDYIRKVPKFLTEWPLTCFEEVVKRPLLWAGQNATVEVTSYSYTHKRQYCYKRVSLHAVAPLKALTGRDVSEYRDAPSRHCINLWSLTHQLLVNYVKTHLGNWGQREQHTNEMLSLIASCSSLSLQHTHFLSWTLTITKMFPGLSYFFSWLWSHSSWPWPLGAEPLPDQGRSADEVRWAMAVEITLWILSH